MLRPPTRRTIHSATSLCSHSTHLFASNPIPPTDEALLLACRNSQACAQRKQQQQQQQPYCRIDKQRSSAHHSIADILRARMPNTKAAGHDNTAPAAAAAAAAAPVRSECRVSGTGVAISGCGNAASCGSKTKAAKGIAQATQKSFYRRELPSDLVSFTSAQGRRLFKESLNAGYAEGYFNLAGNFTVQSEPAYCGPSSLAMVLNALEVDPGRTWKGVWRWYSDELLESCRTETDLKTKGITFDQFACLASSHARVVAKRAGEVTRAEFLDDLRRVAQRDDEFLVLSFSRRALGQTGDGHFSPVGAYHPSTNQALVLDSARYKYPCWFADADRLYDSLQPVDAETGLPRGYFLISRRCTDAADLARAASRDSAVQLPELPADVVPTKLSCGNGDSCCSKKGRVEG